MTMAIVGTLTDVNDFKTAEDRQVMELVYSQAVFGRPYVLPPGVPDERVAALRKAFMAALADPNLLAEAKKMRLDIGPLSGQDVQTLVATLFAMPSVDGRAAPAATTSRSASTGARPRATG